MNYKYHRQCNAVIFLLLTAVALNVSAQSDASKSVNGVKYVPITLQEYLLQVESNSAAVAVKKLAVESAKAQRPFMSTPNINPSLTYSRGSYYNKTPYEPYVAPGSNTYTLSGTIEGWGKRTARTNFSDAEILRNESELNSIVKAARVDAALAYLDSLRVKKIYDSYENAIRKILAKKEKAQAEPLITAQKNSANDLRYFAYTMGVFAGNSSADLLEPSGNLNAFTPREFKVQALVEQALNQRADILYFNDAIKSAQASFEMAKKNRNINLSPSIWLSRTPPYTSSGTDYNKTEAYGFSITVPIPTNLLFDGEIVQEANNKLTLELLLKDLKTRVIAEVNQALMQYQFAKTKLADEEKDYSQAAKGNSDNSAKSIILMRDKEAELLDAKINHAKALIYLQRVSGDYEIPKI
jgi:outer membrane protein TolC